MRYRVEQRIQTLAHNAVMKDGRMEAAFSVDPQLKEEGIAAIDEAAAVCTDSATPNSFGAISPGASPARARVAHLAWAVIVRATKAIRSAPIQIRLVMSSSFRRGTCAPVQPGQGQAECHTERSDGARTYVVSDLD